VVLQSFPQYQVINPYIAALPLVIIIGLTITKDGVEDYRRHKTDTMVNHQTTLTVKQLSNVNRPFFIEELPASFFASLFHRVFGKSTKDAKVYPEPYEEKIRPHTASRPTTGELSWDETYWKDVKVGDFVLLKDNETIPADIVVMSTSDDDCLCYVETKNLDGETNLKIKRGIAETAFIRSTGECGLFGCFIDTEMPTPNLFSFSGSLTIPKDYMNYVTEKFERFGIECAPVRSNYDDPDDGSDGDSSNSESFEENPSRDFNQVPLNMVNLLMRGCVVRNTDWIVGMVVATGDDTKIQQNAGETPSKRSRIEKKMNPQVYGKSYI
jgi:phospholipid-translocating ATPase